MLDWLLLPVNTARTRRNAAADAAIKIVPVSEVRRRAYGEGL